MNYDVQFFIDKFEAIPEEKWCSGFFGYEDTHCANGHCGITDWRKPTREGAALAKILRPLRKESWPAYNRIIFSVTANINDGVRKYPQPTPKQRILAALYDIKAMNEKKDTDTGGKTKTVYVAVPTTISEQAKELLLS